MSDRRYTRADLKSELPDGHFIDGARHRAIGRETFPTIDPSTE